MYHVKSDLDLYNCINCFMEAYIPVTSAIIRSIAIDGIMSAVHFVIIETNFIVPGLDNDASICSIITTDLELEFLFQ